MVLGYWDIRGLAHAIRMLLEFTDTSYEEKQYTCGEAPDYDRSQWLDVKFKLDLDFPNLPYLMDGKNKITQSNAILRYIARKHNMCGDTEEEKIRVDIMENQIMDFRMQLVRLCYNSNHVRFLIWNHPCWASGHSAKDSSAPFYGCHLSINPNCKD